MPLVEAGEIGYDTAGEAVEQAAEILYRTVKCESDILCVFHLCLQKSPPL